MWHCLPLYVRHGLSPWCLDNESNLYKARSVRVAMDTEISDRWIEYCGWAPESINPFWFMWFAWTEFHYAYWIWIMICVCIIEQRRCAYWFWSWLSQRICDICWYVNCISDDWYDMLYVACDSLAEPRLTDTLMCRYIKRMLTAMSTESWERGIYIRSSGSQTVNFKNSASWNGQIDAIHIL